MIATMCRESSRLRWSISSWLFIAITLPIVCDEIKRAARTRQETRGARDRQIVRLCSITATEYALLRILVQHHGKVVTHRQLLQEVWGPQAEEQSQYLRVYMNHLRKKLEPAPGSPKLIRTESGIGYRLDEGLTSA